MRIVVSGYYGFRNMGDEAILATLVQQLGDQAELTVLSADPAATTAEHGVAAIGRTNPGAIARTLRRADLFLSGGGGLLQDATGPWSVTYYAGLMGLARALGTPYGWFGQGVGPVSHPANRAMVRVAARGARFVAVRDQASVDLLAHLGVPSPAITLTADPVLCLRPAAPARIDELLGPAGSGGRPMVAVAIRPWGTWMERHFKAFSAVLAQFAARHDVTLALIPFQQPGDERIAGELRDCVAARPAGHAPPAVLLDPFTVPLTPQEMLGLIGRMDLVIGMRLHALIMAANQGVPALGLAYDPKVAHFARQWDLPCIDSIEALEDAPAFERLLEATWARRGELAAALERRAAEVRPRAERNFELVRGTLGLPDPARAGRVGPGVMP